MTRCRLCLDTKLLESTCFLSCSLWCHCQGRSRMQPWNRQNSRPVDQWQAQPLNSQNQGGNQTEHYLARGDAAIFPSHKFHSVSPITKGCRTVCFELSFRHDLENISLQKSICSSKGLLSPDSGGIWRSRHARPPRLILEQKERIVILETSSDLRSPGALVPQLKNWADPFKRSRVLKQQTPQLQACSVNS